MRMHKRIQKSGGVCSIAVALASIMTLHTNAGAFQIPTGDEDVKINLDNTLRYTLGQRMRGQNKDILNSPQNDDGDRNFDVGIVSSRLDLLTEFDVIYKKNYGIRLSGASWYDPIYRDSLDSKSNTSNHLVNGVPTVGLNKYTKDHFGGDDSS